MKALFHHKNPRFFSISMITLKFYNASQINLSALHSTISVAKEMCHCFYAGTSGVVLWENRLSL